MSSSSSSSAYGSRPETNYSSRNPMTRRPRSIRVVSNLVHHLDQKEPRKRRKKIEPPTETSISNIVPSDLKLVQLDDHLLRMIFSYLCQGEPRTRTRSSVFGTKPSACGSGRETLDYSEQWMERESQDWINESSWKEYVVSEIEGNEGEEEEDEEIAVNVTGETAEDNESIQSVFDFIPGTLDDSLEEHGRKISSSQVDDDDLSPFFPFYNDNATLKKAKEVNGRMHHQGRYKIGWTLSCVCKRFSKIVKCSEAFYGRLDLREMHSLTPKKLFKICRTYKNERNHPIVYDLVLRDCSSLNSTEISATARLLCRSLTSVDFSRCSNLSAQAILDFFREAQNLRRVELALLDVVDDEFLAQASLILPNLERLGVPSCLHVKGSGLMKICQNCPNLKSLDCGYIYQMENKVLVKSILKAKNLIDVDVAGVYIREFQGWIASMSSEIKEGRRRPLERLVCSQIGNGELHVIASKLQNLKVFSCLLCARITDQCVAECFNDTNFGKDLVELDFNGLLLGGDSAVDAIMKNTTENLKKLNLSRFLNMTNSRKEQLFKVCSERNVQVTAL